MFFHGSNTKACSLIKFKQEILLLGYTGNG